VHAALAALVSCIALALTQCGRGSVALAVGCFSRVHGNHELHPPYWALPLAC